MAIHCVAFALGAAALMIRLLIHGPDPLFVMDALLVAIGTFAVAHASTAENEARQWRSLARQKAAEAEELEEAIVRFEKLSRSLDC